MDEIKVGDRVRSYDFPGIADCYIEGTVIDIGRHPADPHRDRYHVQVEREVLEGKEDEPTPAGKIVLPVVNGTPNWLGGVASGVVKIG